MKQTEPYFEVSGSGSIPLVCTHGWACQGEQFAGLSHLLARDFLIFRLDLPGHGQTPLDGFAPGFEAYAEIIADFVLKHDLERPVLLGHSMGGVLSLMAAATGRLRPRAVINLDGSLPPGEKTLAGQQLIRSWLDEPDLRARLAGLFREIFFLASERDVRCEAIIQTMCSAPEAVLRFLPEQAGGLKPELILPKISVPVLFVGAAIPLFDSPKAAATISRLQVERIPDAGHFLHIYAADRVAVLLKSFLKSAIRD